MPPSEKARLQARQNEDDDAAAASVPTDLPPSYEHIIISPASTPSIAQPSQPSAPIPSQNPLSAISRLSSIPFTKYRIRDAKLSDDQYTVTTTKADLTSGTGQQYALTKFLHEQALLPPKPLMVVRGTHLGSSGQYGEPVVDFELRFNLTSMLDLEARPSDGHRRSRVRVKPFQSSGPSGSPKQLSREYLDLTPMEQWAKKFCEDKADNRSFTLNRTTRSLPTAMLEGMVRTLLAAAKYRGKVSVEFPLQHAEVVVSRQSGNWFTNMLRLYPTKKYEVVEVVWDVVGASTTSAGEEDGGGNGGSSASSSSNAAAAIINDPSTSSSSSSHPETDSASGSGPNPPSSQAHGRAAQVAQEWWREWQFATWNAVLGGKRGWVTVEDWIEARMGVREKERPREWGVDYA